MILSLVGNVQATPANETSDVARIVSQIQHADYEGDRAAMQRGFDLLKPFVQDKTLASRVRYWRGFAQWRKAINGFNDKTDPKELEQNLKDAIEEFKIAGELDPKFADAKIGLISCWGYLAFINRADPPRAQEFIKQTAPLAKEVGEAAADNPRLAWTLGPRLWNMPPEKGGGQDKAIENYERGLAILAKAKPGSDPLEPSWGKPELMMSLAYSYLNKQIPDVDAAERYARGALEIVPYWHYTRDILLPQILSAKAKQK